MAAVLSGAEPSGSRPVRSSSAERHLRPHAGGSTMAKAERAAMARHLELRQCGGGQQHAHSHSHSHSPAEGAAPQQQQRAENDVKGHAVLPAKRSVRHLLSRMSSRRARRQHRFTLLRHEGDEHESSRSPEIGGSACRPDMVAASKSADYPASSGGQAATNGGAEVGSEPPRVRLSLVRVGAAAAAVADRSRRKRKHKRAAEAAGDAQRHGAKRPHRRPERYKVQLWDLSTSTSNEQCGRQECSGTATQTDAPPQLANSESQCSIATLHAEVQASAASADCGSQAVAGTADASTQRSVHARDKQCQAGGVPALASTGAQTDRPNVPPHCKAEQPDAAVVGSPQRRAAAAQSLLLLATTAGLDSAAPPDEKAKGDVRDHMEPAGIGAEPAGAASSSTRCSDAEFWQLASVCVDAAGGARSLHCDWRRVCTHYAADRRALWSFCRRFVDEGVREPRESQARYTIAVVADGAGSRHGCVGGMPNLIHTLAEFYPKMPVKVGSLTSSRDTTTMTMASYRDQVVSSYSQGTFRYGPLEALSCVGRKKEECGAVMEPLLDALEAHPVLALMTPWGPNSTLNLAHRQLSDDGPILWVRPGEQLIPVDEVPTPASDRSPYKSGASSSGRQSSRRSQGRRYVRFDDRTPCHADCVDAPRRTTAAVGMVQAVHAGPDKRGPERRPVKDVIVFDAAAFQYLLNDLLIDIYEPPMNQAPHLWVDEAKLNELRRSGVRYTHTTLRDGDVYFLPRNTVHQFRSVSAVCSVAWHVRHALYERAKIETLDVKVHI